MTRVGLALVAVLVGCSSTTPTSPAVEQFEIELGDAQCARQARCGVIGASEVTACQAQVRRYPPAYSTARAVGAGRLTFDADGAQDCLTALAQARCTVDGQDAATAACLLFSPHVALGKTCEQDGECIGGLCQRNIPLDGCSGVCVAYLALGAACQPTADLCVADAYCDATSSRCVARPALGATCSDDIPCLNGTYCLAPSAPSASPTAAPVPSPSPVCSGPGAAGASCSVMALGNTTCAAGLYCRTAVSPSVCTPTVADGQPCDSLDACPDGDDCVGIAIDPMTGDVTPGVCQKFVDAGGPCNPALMETGCPYDMNCDATKHVCVAAAPAGADCTANGTSGACDTGLYCNGTSGACTAQVPFGDSCTAPTDSTGQDPCNDGSCTNGRCRLVCN